MQIGAMNHPERDILAEIKWIAELEFDFIDLTLEPPAAASWLLNVPALASAIKKYNLGVVGHTAFYLPLASPFPEVRHGAVVELERCLGIFAAVGAKWMNVHPDRNIPFHARHQLAENNVASLRELSASARRQNVGVMVENLPGWYNNAQQLGELLNPLPDLGLHLDIGHANLETPLNTTEELLATYGQRVRHVHLHDNKGGHLDQHLPLGAGTLDIKKHLSSLRAAGYDGTITLEVFTPDSHYLKYSRDRLREWWDENDQ